MSRSTYFGKRADRKFRNYGTQSRSPRRNSGRTIEWRRTGDQQKTATKRPVIEGEPPGADLTEATPTKVGASAKHRDKAESYEQKRLCGGSSDAYFESELPRHEGAGSCLLRIRDASETSI